MTHKLTPDDERAGVRKSQGYAVNFITQEKRLVVVRMDEAATDFLAYRSRAADNCKVELDGACVHGWPSRLVAVGLL